MGDRDAGMSSPDPATVRSLPFRPPSGPLRCLAGSALGLLLMSPLRLGLPLSGEEALWLRGSSGLGRAALDAWVGLATDDRIMRLPVLFLAWMALLAAAVAGERAVGLLGAIAAPVCAALMLAALPGPLLVAAPAPFGLLTGACCLLLATSRIRSQKPALLLLAAGSCLLDPGLASVPLGAAAGAFLGRGEGRNRIARALGIAGLIGAVALLILHPPLTSPLLDAVRLAGSRRALMLRTLVLALSVIIVSWRALRGRPAGSPSSGRGEAGPGMQAAPGPRRGGDGEGGDGPGMEGARASALCADSHGPATGSAVEEPAIRSAVTGREALYGTEFTLTSLGALLGGLVCLLVPGLRHLAPSSAAALLYLSAPLGIVHAWTRASAGRASHFPFVAAEASRPPVTAGANRFPSVTAEADRPPLAAGADRFPTAAAEASRTPPIAAGASRVLPMASAAGASRFPALAAWALVVLCCLGRILGVTPSPRPLPLAQALDAMQSAEPELAEIVVGAGLTRGALAHAARGRGLAVSAAPAGRMAGALSMAAIAPSHEEQIRLAAAIGARVLHRHGVARSKGPALRWCVYRPLTLTLAEGAPRPNIAIVSVDTLRADHLSLYGYGRDTSPNLARWARNGLVYERAMAAAPSTAPSFSSLLTGRLPLSHGVRKNYEFLDAGNWTLPRLLQRAGYETAAFVSSFVLTAENSGLDLGFDRYDQRFDIQERNRQDRPMRLAPALVAAVLPWLEARRDTQRPWFLWVHAIDPHGPYTPLPAYAHAFAGGGRRILKRELIPDYQWLGSLDFFDYLNAYDDEILQTDRALGTLLAEIDAHAGRRGTVVIFVADHGEAFGEHGTFFQHGQSLHSEEIHVPLVVKDSAAPRSGRVAQMVSLLDIVPTILARLRIGSDLPLDGVALDERERTGGIVLSNWRPGEVMAASAPWKLMLRMGRGEHAGSSLYNVMDDPTEARPLPVPADPPAGLMQAAQSLLRRDPLSVETGRALERQQWEALDPDAQQNLRSLGYAGP